MVGFKNYLTLFFLSLLLIGLTASGLKAQLSPGELSQSHAFLEGINNCEQCHSPGGDQLSEKCLICHGAIADQKKNGKGLHAGEEHDECFLCHVEHHGRDYELIYFPDGQDSFDHKQTGFKLEGKHAQLNCRQCHKPELISDDRILKADNISLKTTFLGLSATCAGCHFDEHRGQLSQTCQNCHNTQSWLPIQGFDHDETAYPLVGKHQTVLCNKCHVLETDPQNPEDTDFRRFKPVAFGECSACHDDVHKGRLGPNCSGCHTPTGWKTVNAAEFDHDRTRFPLKGKHRSVTCKKCHGQRSTAEPLKFAACRDCHSDYHQGEFSSRPDHGACEVCHTVDGFTPSTFLISRHAGTDFPLKGAHLAVPCRKCHLIDAGDNKLQYKFTFESETCKGCHHDPHRGQLDKFVNDDGCQSCHTVQSWREIEFDHGTTGYKLIGRHATASCRQCHAGEGKFQAASMKFNNTARTCQSCHHDVHRAQFASYASNNLCASCHTPVSWKKLNFNHDTNSRFALEGAHRRVACNKCHKSESDKDGSFTRYRPLDTKCESCHSTKPINRESF